jgi:hypothetical protein
MVEIFTERLSARVTETDWRKVLEAARVMEIRPAAFIRQAVLTAAQEIIAGRNADRRLDQDGMS